MTESDRWADPGELARALRRLHEQTDEKLRAQYRRSLPFQDGFFDRWERARRLGFGDGASIYESAAVYGDVFVGEHSWIGPNVLLDGAHAPLRIGAFCSISAGVHVYTHDTMAWALTRGKASPRVESVIIADCCYIGSQSIIAAGVTVGEGCVVGANSFVNRDLESGCVYAGSPARAIGRAVVEGDSVRIDYFDWGEKA